MPGITSELAIYYVRIVLMILCCLAAIGKADKDKPFEAAIYMAIAFLLK